MVKRTDQMLPWTMRGTTREPGRPSCTKCGTYKPKMEMMDDSGNPYSKCSNCGYEYHGQ